MSVVASSCFANPQVRNRWVRLEDARKYNAANHGVVEPSTESNGVRKAGYKCKKCGQPKKHHTCQVT